MQPYWEVVYSWCLNLSGCQCSELYQSSFLFPPHTSLTLGSRAGNVNRRQEMSVSDLPIHLGSCFVIARCAFYIHIVEFCHSQCHKQTCVKAGSFPKHTKNICMTYEMSAADFYLNTSVMMAISHPTVIYLWLFGLSAFGGRGQGKDHSFGLCMDHWGTLGLLSVCRILPQNETFYFPNLVK